MANCVSVINDKNTAFVQVHHLSTLKWCSLIIDGSKARRSTAIVTNQRRARLRQSVKFLVSRLFKNTVGIVQSSADIIAK